MPFGVTRTSIPEVVVVEPTVHRDDRGFFMEMYKESEFSAAGLPTEYVQDNFSHSIGPVLRGLHYQLNPHPMGKLVSVLEGEIFDVAVDIRKGSPTYSKWVSATLSTDNNRMLWVPPGFAHGFCVLSDQARVLYKVTGEYSKEHDRGIMWNDPAIGVEWPLEAPRLSPRDESHPGLEEADNNFEYET
jgi:dTDP-4-dehydrorhamnose 3,5-epimerase